MPKVSILIPCYNARLYVEKAVSSALRQSHENIEVIVVDDGSTDGSEKVLSSIRDKRLRIIKQDNQGQCAAANAAYRACSGEWIKFFDADDLLSPSHIQLQLTRLHGRANSVAMGEWARFYDVSPTETSFPHLPMYRDSDPVSWLAAEWLNARPMMQCGLWLLPRNVLDRSGLWNEKLSLINDFEFFARVLLCAEEILFTPGARLYYRSGLDTSLSGQKTRKAVESAFHSLMLGTDHLIKAEDSERTRQACANVLQDFDYTYYPYHSDLRARVRKKVRQLGGSTLAPDGPPRFHQLRKLVGWRAARRVQRALGR